MFDLAAVQAAIREQGLDGWLLYDFRGLNVLARRVLALPAEAMLTRRWFYFVAARHTRSAYDVAFGYIAGRVRRDGSVREAEVQRQVLDHFAAHGLVTDHPPIVAVGPHSGDPHYAPGPGSDAPMRGGDFVLIDL